MPGPPPKAEHQRRRRNPTPGQLRLPRAGRTGKPPAWPLSKPSGREMARWKRLWKLPQAVAWDRLACIDVVARYVRLLVDAEQPDAHSTLLAEVRQLEDRIGLTPMAMLRLRWVIEDEGDSAGILDRSRVIDIRDRIKGVVE